MFVCVHAYVCMRVLPKYMSMYHTCVWFPQRPEEGVISSETGVKTVVSHLVDAGNQTRFLGRAAGAFNY